MTVTFDFSPTHDFFAHKPLGMLSPRLHDGELADAVFRVAATLPMKRMSIGVPQQELPFDVKGFLAEIEREENNH